MSRVVDGLEQHRDAGGFVLPVAVHGDEHVVIVHSGEVERRDQGRAVAAVPRVIDATNAPLR